MEQVALLKCENYQQENVDQAIDEIWQLLAVNAVLPAQGSKIFLKPNLLMSKTPEHSICTHPVVVEAVAKKLLALGYQVIIGDSPAGPFNVVSLKNVYKNTGMLQVAANTGCQLNYNIDSVNVATPHGLLLKTLPICCGMLEADAIINIAKLKTHGFAVYSGAVKNMFGCVPGLTKLDFHLRMPDVTVFHQALIDICLLMKPVLSIIDGISGMEGDGPSGGDPRQANVLLASTNAFAVDLVAATLIGLDVKQVPLLPLSLENGLTPTLGDIKLLGAELADLQIKDWKLSKANTMSTADWVPLFAKKTVDKIVTPIPQCISQKCIGCGICAESCPPKTIAMVNKKPVMNLEHCIHCFCCQEMCPMKAITVKRHFLSKLFVK